MASIVELQRKSRKGQGKLNLLEWCRSNISSQEPKPTIADFSTSWQNGLALCSLIYNFRPDLIPNYSNLKKDDPKKNFEIAFNAANELGIPNLIEIEDFLPEEGGPPNEFAVITYVSQFYHLFSKQKNETGSSEEGKVRKSLMDQENCRKCKQKLKGATIPFDGKYMYHLKCFECTSCGIALSDKYINLSNQPYCLGCGKKSHQNTLRLRSQASENEANRQGMQIRAFTNWMNFHLPENLQIQDISKDLSNGIVLIELTKKLFGDKVTLPNYNKNPKTNIHCLDNINCAFKMLEQVGISDPFLKPQNILDGDVKMLLGFIWKMILHLQVNRGSAPEGIQLTEEDGPRQSLLKWCQERLKNYDNVNIQDFQASFQDGMAFLALIHSEKPDALNYKIIDPTRKAENLTMAFQLAEKEFGIPPLLDVEDMLKKKPDERSIITYVSEYAAYFDLLKKDPNDLTPEEKERLSRANKEVSELEAPSLIPEEVELEEVKTFNWEELKLDGILKKQDPGFPWFWQKRYFTLQGSRLVYYKDVPTGPEVAPMGYISLTFIKSVEQNKVKPNSFMLVSPDRVYYFEAGSKELTDWWIKGLNKAISIFKRQSPLNIKIEGQFPIIVQQKEYKEGYLYELSMLRQWKYKFFVLKDGILFSFKNKGEARVGRIPLQGCKLEEYQLEDQKPHEQSICFKLTTPKGKTTIYRAEDWQQMQEWSNAILKQQLIIEEFVKNITF